MRSRELMHLTGVIAAVAMAGCASPQRLCGSIVGPNWTYVGPVNAWEEQFGPSLPRPPYRTNTGVEVRRVRHLWYTAGADERLACTLSTTARDDCSVRSTEFRRINGSWELGRENAVLCNVTLR